MDGERGESTSDELLLQSLSTIAGERDAALSLLTRTTQSLFQLLGPEHNSSKLLSSIRMLLSLLKNGQKENRHSDGGDDSGSNSNVHTSNPIDMDPCRSWSLVLEHIEAVLAGAIKLQKELRDCDDMNIRENMNDAEDFVSCPDPPRPRSHSSISTMPPTSKTVPQLVSRETVLLSNEAEEENSASGKVDSNVKDRTVAKLHRELASARLALKFARDRQFFPDVDEDNDADRSEEITQYDSVEAPPADDSGSIGNVLGNIGRVLGLEAKVQGVSESANIEVSNDDRGPSVAAISRRELLLLLEKERRKSFAARNAAMVSDNQRMELQEKVDDLVQIAATAGALRAKETAQSDAPVLPTAPPALSRFQRLVVAFGKKIKTQATAQAEMRLALDQLSKRVQRLDDVRTMEMQRLHEAGGRLRRELEVTTAVLRDAEKYIADLEMELVMHGLGVASSSTGLVGQHAIDLDNQSPLFCANDRDEDADFNDVDGSLYEEVVTGAFSDAQGNSRAISKQRSRDSQQNRQQKKQVRGRNAQDCPLATRRRLIFGREVDPKSEGSLSSFDDNEVVDGLNIRDAVAKQRSERRRRLLARINPLSGAENAQALHRYQLRMEVQQDEQTERGLPDVEHSQMSTQVMKADSTSQNEKKERPDDFERRNIESVFDELLREVYEWEEKTGDLVASWVDVDDLESPPVHSLYSPVINELLCQWTGDDAKKQALVEWMTRVLSGDALDTPEARSSGMGSVGTANTTSGVLNPSKSDNGIANGGTSSTHTNQRIHSLPPVSSAPTLNGGFVPCLQLMKLRRETLDGFMAVVFPLLLRRRDIAVNLSTRERRTTVYDVRVQVQSTIAAKIKKGAFGQNNISSDTPDSLSRSQSESAVAMGVQKESLHPQSTAINASTVSLNNHISGFNSKSESSHNSEAAWRARHRMCLIAALTGYLEEKDVESEDEDYADDEGASSSHDERGFSTASDSGADW